MLFGEIRIIGAENYESGRENCPLILSDKKIIDQVIKIINDRAQTYVSERG